MNDVDELLRQAMAEHTEAIGLPQGLAARSLQRARRRSRVEHVLAVTAAVAVAGSAAAVLVGSAVLDAGVGAGSRPATVSGASASTSAGSSRVVTPSGPVPDGLASVTLADPAPGFPYRKLPDGVRPTVIQTVHGTQTVWVATFVVDASAHPTAQTPGATVYVGTYPLPISSDHTTIDSTSFHTYGYTIDGRPAIMAGGDADDPSPVHNTSPIPVFEKFVVVATPMVQGHQGYLFETTFSRVLYFSSGRFTIKIETGLNSTVDQLVTLGDALTGLR